MRVIDISVPLKSLKMGMHVYPGDTPYFARTEKTIHKDGMRLSRLELVPTTARISMCPRTLSRVARRRRLCRWSCSSGPAWVADLTAVSEGMGITIDS